jgi:hypothetical protein
VWRMHAWLACMCWTTHMCVANMLLMCCQCIANVLLMCCYSYCTAHVLDDARMCVRAYVCGARALTGGVAAPV